MHEKPCLIPTFTHYSRYWVLCDDRKLSLRPSLKYTLYFLALWYHWLNFAFHGLIVLPLCVISRLCSVTVAPGCLLFLSEIKYRSTIGWEAWAELHVTLLFMNSHMFMNNHNKIESSIYIVVRPGIKNTLFAVADPWIFLRIGRSAYLFFLQNVKIAQVIQ